MQVTRHTQGVTVRMTPQTVEQLRAEITLLVNANDVIKGGAVEALWTALHGEPVKAGKVAALTAQQTNHGTF